MSTPDPNDLRDPHLDAVWRAASNEEPPRALDDAIRAAARREVGAGPQPAGARTSTVPSALRPERWWAPLAAAAAIGAIAIGILQLTNSDKVSAPASDQGIVSDMPAAPSSTVTTAPPAMPPPPQAESDARSPALPPAPVAAPAPPLALRKDAAAPPAKERDATKTTVPAPIAPDAGGRQAGAIDAAKPAAPLAEPFPADAIKREAKQSAADSTSPPASMPAETGAGALAAGKLKARPAPFTREEAAPDEQRASAPMAQTVAPASPAPMRRLQESESARAGAPMTGAANAAADATAGARAKGQPKLAVPDWIALIRKLRDEGKTDEAAKELAAFRAAYPDHERLLPPDLRDWKPQAR